MILEFSIANFRSIGDEQVLSFYSTGAQGGMLGNTVEFRGVPCRLLKSIAFYGANASGKTNVLRALWALRRIISHSYGLAEGDVIRWYDPCIFHSDKQDDGTRFEIEFTIPLEGVESRFLYKVAFNGTEILEESLSSFAKVREAVLFQREKGDTRETIGLGASLKGGERRMAFFKNQAYLSVAGRNPAAPEVLRAIYRYFRSSIKQIRLNEQMPFGGFSKRNDAVNNLITFVDVGVANVETRIAQISEDQFRFPPNMPEAVRRDIVASAGTHYYFKHETGDGKSGTLELDEESDGTKRLFELFPDLIRVLTEGGVFIIDEIESGMHPFMAEVLVKLFNDPEVNEGQAQLIFTTHNSNLLSPNILRRDQIWFSEKKNGRSSFFSLDSFDKKVVTPSSPFGKWYLEGRFGAIPNIDYAGLSAAVRTLRNRKEKSNA